MEGPVPKFSRPVRQRPKILVASFLSAKNWGELSCKYIVFFIFLIFNFGQKCRENVDFVFPKYQLFLRQNAAKTVDFDFHSGLSQKEDLCASFFVKVENYRAKRRF